MKSSQECGEVGGPEALRLADEKLALAAQFRVGMQVHSLLAILREMERFSFRLSEAQVDDALHEAVLACGFADEVDAWDCVMAHFHSGICSDASCAARCVSD